MRCYVLSILLSAFLLFQVQPLVGKIVLPWFGGGATVWTVCLLFFQSGLMFGYLYAHLLSRRFSPRNQVVIHGGLLLLSLAWLPPRPGPESLAGVDLDAPTLQLIRILAATVGVPYLLLSATGPLLQSWFADRFPGRSVYRLYAISNFGSLTGLLIYPFLVEPYLDLDLQAGVWAILYIGFAILCAVTGFRFARGKRAEAPEASSTRFDPGLRNVLFWIALSALPSTYLLATTTQLSEQVTVLPFLWILPLALYLITFILTFDHPRWYDRRIAGPLFLLAAGATAWVLEHQNDLDILPVILVYSLSLFATGLCAHGELARRKPDPRHLTGFYLAVAGGGVTGSAIVVFLAPALLPDYIEFPMALAAALILIGILWVRAGWRRPVIGNRILVPALTILPVLLIQQHLVTGVTVGLRSSEMTTRNFYGVLKVDRHRNHLGAYRALIHGRIQHGTQYLAEELRNLPTTYYTEESGIGLALRYPPGPPGPPGRLKVGVVGLGVGTLSTYLAAGDTVRYYELNPNVLKVAQSYFSFLDGGNAETETILGDARLRMDGELRDGHPQGFDVLVIDAFASHAIPVHLLTVEAGRIYLTHLKPGGVLVINITHAYLDLAPVARGLADELGLEARLLSTPDDPLLDAYAADWVLLTRNRSFLAQEPIRRVSAPVSPGRRILWTDRYASLWPLFRS